MDKIVLSKDQLQQLSTYIGKRSLRFSDPIVMQEILDHFACKVEELLSAKPGMDFNDAMLRAHRSFGVKGFAPIADHIEQSLVRKYKKASYKEMKSVLLSFHIAGILAVGMLTYWLISYLLRELHDDTSFILYLNAPIMLYAGLVAVYRYKKLKELRGYKMLLAAAYQASPVSLTYQHVLGYWVFGVLFTGGMLNLTFTSFYIPFVVMFTIFSLIVQSRLLDQAIAEADGLEYQKQSLA